MPRHFHGPYDALTSERPNHTIAKPKRKLSPTYSPSDIQWRCCSIRYMSSAKEEKVVKPPQNPVMRNTFIEGDITFDLSARPKNIPITKLPITLTEKVPQGKADEVTA